jgi:tetratricopeptide (TPR) repeat protein
VGSVALAVLILVVSLLAGRVEHAAAQQPEAEILVSEAILAFEDQRYEAARRALLEALRFDPDNVPALYYLGLVHLAERQPQSAVPVLDRARARAPQDTAIQFQLGVAYFTLGDYDKADPLLSAVFEREPRLDGLGYYVGFMRYRKKDYQGALRAFSTGRATDAGLQQLTRLYTGLSLGILGLPERAAQEIEAALRAQPASPLTGPAERIRDTLLAGREREQRLRAEVRIGVLFDDNIATNPRRKPEDPIVHALRARESENPGGLVALRVEYAWWRTGSWEATAGYSFLQTENSLPAFNIRDHLGTLGVAYRGTLAAMPYQLIVQYGYDHLSVRDELFLQRHTGSVFGVLIENQTHLSTAQIRIQGKDFSDPIGTSATERRDADNFMAGLGHVMRFASDKHLLRLGYQFDDERADGRNFSYYGHRILAGAQYTLPWKQLRLKYDYDVHVRQYDHRHASLPVAAPGTLRRNDTEHTHVVRVEQPLPWSLTAAAELQAIRSRSNLPIFSFDRNVWSLQLSWQY